jgi:endo-1,4-beta-xylanase
MSKHLIQRILLLVFMGVLVACGGGKKNTTTPTTSSKVASSKALSSSSSSTHIDTCADLGICSSSASSIRIETCADFGTCSSSSSSSSATPGVELVVNGGFEVDAAESTMPTNWALKTGGATTMKVIESTPGMDAHAGTKALKVDVQTILTNPWDSELVNSDLGIDIEAGKEYIYSFWVKGTVSKKVNFTVGTPATPAPAYSERARSDVVLTGAWQEVKMTVTAGTSDTKLRFATHVSIAGNAGATLYFDDLSFKLNPTPTDLSPVTVTHLYQLSPDDMPIGIAQPAGGAGNSLLKSAPRQTVVKQHFSQLTAENIMKPSFLHPSQGTYFYTDADALVKFAKDNNMSVHGHTLLWHAQIPSWMENFQGDKAAWIAMMEDHVTNVASHFETAGGSTIKSWDVVNEAFEDAGGRYRGEGSGSGSSVWYENIGAEFIERAFVKARAADPDVDLYYNDFNLEWNGAKLTAVINMVKDFKARGIPINGVGFQMHVWSTNNIATLKSHFQQVVAIDPSIKIKLSELDVRFNHVTPALMGPTNKIYEDHKKIVYETVKAYLEAVPVAQRGGITVWGLADVDSWILGLYGRPDWPLFFFNDLQPKPALQGFADALSGI